MSAASLYCPVCGAANAAAERVCFACQHDLTKAADEHEDEFLLQGRYQILSQVGTGGFGAVYQARDMQRGQQLVAVKQINLRGLTPQETIEATDGFNREVQMLSTLAHEHLPRIHDHFTDAEHWYLVMDFIAGQTLERYLLDEAVSHHAIRMLSFDEILDIGLQVCEVLHYLHTRQPAIIFRDLKPSNIMRTPQGKLYLIDFGIARRFTPGKPKDTIPLGSPGYAAPEQYGKAQTTPRADVYSLGALLHHLLSGTDPAETPFSFLPLRLYGSSGLAELEALISRMVALDAAKRPVSIDEVRSELQRIVDLRAHLGPRIWQPPLAPGVDPLASSGPIHYWQLSPSGSLDSQATQGLGAAGMPGPGQQQQGLHMPGPGPTSSSRRNLLVNGLAAGVGLLVGGVPILTALQKQRGGGFHYHHHRHEEDQAQYEESAQEQRPERELQKYSSAVEALAWSPDGNYLAIATGSSTIAVWNTQTWLSRIFRSTDAVHSLSWSPDSKLLANTAGKTLQVWNVKQRQIVYQQYDAVKSRRNVVRWSPGSSRLAVADNAGTVNIFDAGDPQQMKVLKTYNNLPMRSDNVLLGWSPDSASIIASVFGGMQVRDVLSGAVERLFGQPQDNPVALGWSRYNGNIALTNGDTIIQVWDAQTGAKVMAYETDGESNAFITSVAWSAQARYLSAATTSGRLYFWDAQAQQARPVSNYSAPQSSPASASVIAWSPTEPRIAVGYEDGRCLIWRAPLTT